MSGTDYDIEGSRIAPDHASTITWSAVCETDVTGWVLTNKLIISVSLTSSSHTPATEVFRLRARNVTDAGSFFDVVTGSGEVRSAASAGAINNGDAVGSSSGCETNTVDASEEIENESPMVSGSLSCTQNDAIELQFCVDMSNALNSKQYEFTIYSDTESTDVDTPAAAQVTTEAAAESESDYSIETRYEVEVRDNYSIESRYEVEVRDNYSIEARYEAEIRDNYSIETRYEVEVRDNYSIETRYAVVFQDDYSIEARYEVEVRDNYSIETRYALVVQDDYSVEARYSIKFANEVSRAGAENFWYLGASTHKNFRNSRGNQRYYTFYMRKWTNGTTYHVSLYVEWSTDGVYWATDPQLVYETTNEGSYVEWGGDFGVKIYDTGSLTDVYLTFIDEDDDLNYKKGTISDSSDTISWSATQQVSATLNRLLGTDASDSPFSADICRTYNGELVIVFTEDVLATDNFRDIKAVGSDGTGASPSWGTEVVLETGSGNSNNKDKDKVYVGCATGFSSSYPDRFVYYAKSGGTNNLESYRMNTQAYDWDYGTDAFAYDSNNNSASHVTAGNYVDGIVDENDFVTIFYYRSAGRARLYHVAGGVFPDSTTIVPHSIATNVTGKMTIDRTSSPNRIYFFYRISNNVRMKSAISQSTSLSSETTITTETPISISSDTEDRGLATLPVAIQRDATPDDVYHYVTSIEYETNYSIETRYLIQFQSDYSIEARYEVSIESTGDYSIEARYETEIRDNYSIESRYETEIRDNYSIETRYLIQFQDDYSVEARYETEIRDNYSIEASYEVELRDNYSIEVRYQAELRDNYSIETRYETEVRDNYSIEARYLIEIGVSEADYSIEARYEAELRGNYSIEARYALVVQDNYSIETRYEVEVRDNYSIEARYALMIQDDYSIETRYEVIFQDNYSIEARYATELRGNYSVAVTYRVFYVDPLAINIDAVAETLHSIDAVAETLHEIDVVAETLHEIDAVSH